MVQQPHLLGMYPEKTLKDTCSPMFTAAPFTTAKAWKQPRCPFSDKWINKKWYLYMMEYYSVLKK